MGNIVTSGVSIWNCKKGCKEQISTPSGDCEVCGGLMFRADGKSMNALIGEHEAELWRIWNGVD